ncbi:MAG TPA: hypothetical protein VLV50_01780, partial [Stellaceae bacterium]|nr:hypothetical protein [Stellaceae bacterium]
MPIHLRWPFARLAAAACFLVSALALASCGEVKVPILEQGPQATAPGTQATPPAAAAPQVQPLPPISAVPSPAVTAPGKINVALLLPLSGPSGTLGQAMLNAAQM